MKTPIQVTTTIKLDFFDALKCLFGRALHIRTNIHLPPDYPEVKNYNAYAECLVVTKTESRILQDCPQWGYTIASDPYLKKEDNK